MTKKCYACILTSRELAEAIKALTDAVLAKGGMTKAYGAIKQIAEMNDKFIHDFGDIDPSWTPPVYNTQPAQPTIAAPAMAYAEETYQ